MSETNQLPPAPMQSVRNSPEVKAMFEQLHAEEARRQAERPQIEEAGVAALHRLMTVAEGHSGQCRYVAQFLLGCYNGQRFPFDLTSLRALDYALFDDCLAVLKMDCQPKQEVHGYIDNGGVRFELLAKNWNVLDVLKLRIAAEQAGVPVSRQ